MLPRYVVLLLLMAWVDLSARAAGAGADSAADEELLRAANIPTDGPGLLDFFRKRTPDAPTRSRIQTLIRQLGSSVFAQRERAGRELVSFGPQATALLRKAMNHTDLEVRWRRSKRSNASSARRTRPAAWRRRDSSAGASRRRRPRFCWLIYRAPKTRRSPRK